MKIIVDKLPELKSECLFVGLYNDHYVCRFYGTLSNPMCCILKSDKNGNPYCPFLKEESKNVNQTLD